MPKLLLPLSDNYSYFGRFWLGLRAVLSFRGRLKYVLIAKFYAESNGCIHCFSGQVIAPQFDSSYPL